MTGVPGGVGLFMKLPSFLKDGDEVRVEIENIGTIQNTMAFEKETRHHKVFDLIEASVCKQNSCRFS